ncbi:MAG: hypothetical protein IKD14_04470 [Clostridia bacterium]|nr:hypothetical protein [Clostridia bacterium]
MEKKDNFKGIKIALGIFLSVLLPTLAFFMGFVVGQRAYPEDIETINYIIDMYKKHYYEESDDIVQIIEDALLDKYSTYYTAEEYDLIKQSARGAREGIGISVYPETKQIAIVAGNSPAKKAGVKEGSYLLAIKAADDVDFTPINVYEDFTQKLATIPKDTDFSLKLKEGDGERVFTLQKKQYTQSYVSYFDDSGEYVFEGEGDKFTLTRYGDNTTYPMGDRDKTALIRYTGFSGNEKNMSGSSAQFAAVLAKFKSDGKTNLIIDLRGNGGGYVNIMCDIAAHLIDGEKGASLPVMIARDKHGNETVYSSGAVRYSDYGFTSIVFLADSGSASASEALMGAVLDYDKNNIVNVILSLSEEDGASVAKTYGKGIMQTTYARGFTGAAIKLTTAKIYWPVSGICIHGVGITEELSPKARPESFPGLGFYDALSYSK